MTTMLEKMARALAMSDGYSEKEINESLGDPRFDLVPLYTDQARAALQAIRVPSVPVAAAGQWDWLRNVMGFTSPTPPVRDCVEANAKACQNFTAMIDAILSEDEKKA